MTTPVAVPTGNAGELLIPALGKTIKQVEWREDDFLDTMQVPVLTPSAGLELEFFRDLSQKNIQHTNIKVPRRIPSGSEFIMTRIGVLIHQAYGNVVMTDADILKLAYSAAVNFHINDRLIVEGLLVKFQSGYGVTGSTTRSNTGVVTLGVPSAAAAPNLLVAQTIKDDDDLHARMTFRDNSWLLNQATPAVPQSQMPTFDTRPVVSVMLHGLIKKPQGK